MVQSRQWLCNQSLHSQIRRVGGAFTQILEPLLYLCYRRSFEDALNNHFNQVILSPRCQGFMFWLVTCITTCFPFLFCDHGESTTSYFIMIFLHSGLIPMMQLIVAPDFKILVEGKFIYKCNLNRGQKGGLTFILEASMIGFVSLSFLVSI